MNAGKPVIVSDQVGCAPDLIKNGDNGFIFPARDIDALKKRLESIIFDPKISAKMAKNSLEKINSWGYEEDMTGLQKALGI